MDVYTLLARQMELHTSVRHPPKTAAELVRFRGQMHHYKTFFTKLKWMSQKLSCEVDTTFQCLMYISLGGVVSFDKQHQDGSVPMHQAKVLARDAAIQLEPELRRLVPHEELMVYVGASKDLRATLRVKVEDSNDLVTAEKSVNEAVEYLDFIYTESCGVPETMFAFYMVEDEQSLNRLLESSSPSPLSSSGPAFGSTFSGTVTQGSTPMVDAPLEPLPPVNSLVAETRRLCEKARDVRGKAPERLAAAQTVAQWLRDITPDDFTATRSALMNTLDEAVSVLIAEKRSALCRTGCDIVSCVMLHATGSPQLFADGEQIAAIIGRWVASLCRGIYVTVSAIATATDYTLRDVVTQSHGSVVITKALVTAFEGGAQTELRRKCLGYMCLTLSAADGDRRTLLQLARLLIPVSQRYVSVGDSPSRKMARALVAVLRIVTGESVPMEDEKTERLVTAELGRVREALSGGPRTLETLIFESDNFISSMKRPAAATGAASGVRPLGAAAAGTAGLVSPLARRAPAATTATAASSEPLKCPRVSPHSGAFNSAPTGSSPPQRERRTRSDAHHTTGGAGGGSGVRDARSRPSAAPGGDPTQVYETNDSLVAPHRTTDAELESGASYPSISVHRVSTEAATNVPYTAGSHQTGTVMPVASRTDGTRLSSNERVGRHEPNGAAEDGSHSLPRMSPSLQRKIAQSRPKPTIE